MNTPDLARLNKQFAFSHEDQQLHFATGKGEMPLVEIKNKQASATIGLQGAHLLSWIPAGEEEVIWLSSDAVFATGKSIRGGIPVCWPWFGAHEKNSSCPAHGFARTVYWQVTNARALPGGETCISFTLDSSTLEEYYQAMWPQPVMAEYTLTIGKVLRLELTTYNKSDEVITLGQALHTYFNVGDITDTVVYGLEGKDYLDKTDGFKRKTQAGPVLIEAEVDRVYLQTPDDVVIDNARRKIVIRKQGSLSTVVWNPGREVAEKMGDLGKDGYLAMLCVESANAAEDTVLIKAGDQHTLHVTYSIES